MGQAASRGPTQQSDSKVVLAVAVLVTFADVAHAQGGCTVKVLFNHDAREVTNTPQAKILAVLAQEVFKVPVKQVAPVGKLGQSGVLQSQSVASYRAVGFPVAPLNGKDVCANCEDATSRRFLGLRSFELESSIQAATNSWWPNDKADVQSATCTAS